MANLYRTLMVFTLLLGCLGSQAFGDDVRQTDVIGGGGGSENTDQCSGNDYLVGIITASGKDLNQITALCQPFQDGKVAGDTYTLTTWGVAPEATFAELNNTTVCAKNKVAVGITVQVSKVDLVHTFKLTCAQPKSSKTSDTKWSPTKGGEGAVTGSADCAGGLAVGMAFRYGSNIDALGLLCVVAAAPVDTTPPETQPHPVMLESTNFPGMFVRHKNFQAVLTTLSTPTDFQDATFTMEPALTNRGRAAVSFESTNFPGMFLRHKNFRLVLEKNDGSDQFAKDASFTMWPGPNGASGFEASNFPLYFIRHKDLKLWVEKTDDSKQFHADSGFMVRSPTTAPVDNPKTDNAGDGNCTITEDVDVYPAPGDDQGQKLPFIDGGSRVTSTQRQDDWFRITGANVPNGQGWVYKDFIRCN